MLTIIESVLSKDEVRQFRDFLDRAPWHDGAATAGSLAQRVKANQQLDDSAEVANSLGNHILRKLGETPRFISAALPRKIYPPKFNRYQLGGHYGTHIDSAVMQVPGTNTSLRSDLAATLFLTEADDYDGGELEIESDFGVQSVKLSAGDLVLYPASSMHRVLPVTSGVRLASFFWIESLVGDDGERALLFDLDQAIQDIAPASPPEKKNLLKLTGIYHNLLRRWAIT
ncbi:MAG: Fe2+-dependent dioxygenase [Pseudomonadota bacterium]